MRMCELMDEFEPSQKVCRPAPNQSVTTFKNVYFNNPSIVHAT